MATLGSPASIRFPAAVEQQLEALSPRDRQLLVGLVLFLLLVATGGFWYLLHSTLQDQKSRLSTLQDALTEIEALEKDFRAADATFQAQKGRLESHQPLTTWVEELANRHALGGALSAVRETGREQVGDIMQIRYMVELKRAQQEPLYRFLYEFETSGFPAKVEQAVFRVASVRNEKLMDLTLDVEVFSLVGGGER